MSSQDYGIELRGVHRRFGRQEVLAGVDLAIPRGETTVLLGRNGVGKSTVVRLCLGTLRAQRGEVRVLGQDPARRRTRWQERIGHVPDRPDVPGWMRLDDLLRAQRIHHRHLDAEFAQEMAGLLGVPRKSRIGSMSRGESMKAMLVAALASAPEVLLLDEPFGGLDAIVREEFLRGVLSVLEEPRPTVLLVTHDLDVAARLADRLAVLKNGVIVREGPVDAFASDAVAAPQALQAVLRDEVEQEAEVWS